VNNKGAKFDSFSNKITWFGHKVHLSVDTISELPIAIEVTPTHVNDGEVDPTLIGNVTDCTNSQVEFLIMDGGCNQLYEKPISFYQIEN
jgi:IS5 family transposase